MISQKLKDVLPQRFGLGSWLNCKDGDGNVVVSYFSATPDSFTGYLFNGLKKTSTLSKLSLIKAFINKNLDNDILDDSDLEFACAVETDTSIGLVIAYGTSDMVNITIATSKGWQEFYNENCLIAIYGDDSPLLKEKAVAKDYDTALDNYMHKVNEKTNYVYQDDQKVEQLAELLLGSCGSLKEYYVEHLDLEESDFEHEKDELACKISNYVIRCKACGNWSAYYKRHCDDCEQPIA